MTDLDYDDEKVDQEWQSAMRVEVESYLANQGVAHGAIGDVAAWHVAPLVSIWAIESLKVPDSVGWWAISGDLPTDYVSAATIKHPRGALRAICNRWADMASHMRRGISHPTISMGAPESWPELAELLQARVELLREFAATDEAWDYDESEFEGARK